MRQRYKIEVTIVRGDHEPYKYVYLPKVKASKVDRKMEDAIMDVMENVTRGNRYHCDLYDFDGMGITVGISGPIAFMVKKVRL